MPWKYLVNCITQSFLFINTILKVSEFFLVFDFVGNISPALKNVSLRAWVYNFYVEDNASKKFWLKYIKS